MRNQKSIHPTRQSSCLSHRGVGWGRLWGRYTIHATDVHRQDWLRHSMSLQIHTPRLHYTLESHGSLLYGDLRDLVDSAWDLLQRRKGDQVSQLQRD